MEKKILDWSGYISAARLASAEGCVLLKNENETLPFRGGCRLSVFGRVQNNYYKSGTGSGGMVNVSRVVDIMEGLRGSGEVVINEELAEIYSRWDKENPPDKTMIWGQAALAYPEMPLTDELVKKAASVSDAALIIIGRTGGEDCDITDREGGYRLMPEETDMIRKVSAEFGRTAVILNTGGLIDMSFADDEGVGAVMYVWQGGMTGGYGVADVMTGKVGACGKLPDTIAYELSDYPSDKNFGDDNKNLYEEDIYVGYRWFETFAPERVRYPFGFGLSYTCFDISAGKVNKEGNTVKAEITVKNTGKYPGKEVVQIYVSAPQGVLGKPARELKAYRKTSLLDAGSSETLSFETDINSFASYDAAGKTGFRSAMVLEKGTYSIYAGNSVRSAEKIFEFTLDEDICVEQLAEAMPPVEEFDIVKPELRDGKFVPAKEKVPTMTIDEKKRVLDALPADMKYTGDKGIKLADVRAGKNTMEEFIAQLSDHDLACIVRGEGLSSPLVTPGTTSAFGGVSEELRNFGIPAVCTADGPSGIRLDCGNKAFSLPIGTMLASTFNDELVEKLYSFTGMELIVNNVDCLLGPGMNIHRHPLNGRNFEYFSEDPLLTGKMAASVVRGIQSAGTTGVIKHFCGNDQEHNRYSVNNVISERALREIYLKGFETAVKEGHADSVMTTYGPVNGLWTAGNYDLDTFILRGEWGFDGIVMTDWWADINVRGGAQCKNDFAAMVRAQNDMYMVCPRGDSNAHNDNTEKALAEGTLTRGELCRSAANICRFAMGTYAMKRLLGEEYEVEVINRPAADEEFDFTGAVPVELDESVLIDLTEMPSHVGDKLKFDLQLAQSGDYKVTVTASSELGELAQIPCTLFVGGKIAAVFGFTGTGGKDVGVERTVSLNAPSEKIMLYVGQFGIELRSMKIEKE